ncbi:MAG: hypothetical protein WDZ62_00580 [Candidatus Pacearchaeota archaeon]
MDFLWHKVSEKEKEEIKEDAKNIIDSFSQKLNRVKGNLDKAYFERDEFERKEEGKLKDFSREVMFDNAPKKNKDFIIGEKGKW